MSVSLEARIPLLDPEVFTFAWRLPLSKKIRGGRGKWLLRELLSRYIPRTLIERPKMGFGVPIGAWLRGPLRPWAESLLDRTALASGGMLDADVVQRRWAEHQRGSRDWQFHLWNVLSLQAWLSTQ
jgi:asparagine synthase (glutamine-hydrolysing)